MSPRVLRERTTKQIEEKLCLLGVRSFSSANECLAMTGLQPPRNPLAPDSFSPHA
jgi:hypothetical protein